MSRHSGKRRTAGMVAILVACIAGASAYAFTATNTVTAQRAGVGNATIGSYTVIPGSINYQFDASGAFIQTVGFDVGASATSVAASLASPPTNTSWATCAAGSGTTWVCDFKGSTGLAPAGGTTYTANTAGWVVAASKLTVAAVENGVVTINP